MPISQLNLWQAIATTVAAIGALVIVWQLCIEWWLSKAKIKPRFLLRKNAGIVYTATNGTMADNLLKKEERCEKKIKVQAGNTEVKLFFRI